MAQHQVLVAGAGPTGLALALFLARQGVSVRIVDKHPGPGSESRAIVVHARTLEFYRQIGIAEEVVSHGVKVERLRLWEEGKNVADIPLDDLGQDLSPYPFILSFTQDDHERLLVAKLREAGIEVEWNTQLVGFEQDADGVRATLTTGGGNETCAVEYLCGCDGAHSVVREGLGFGFAGGTYDQTFFVADVNASGPPTDDGLNMCLNVKDFCIVLPIRGTGRQRLIGIIPEDMKGREGIVFEDLRPYLERLFGIDVGSVNWFSVYRVHHRVAESFRRGRVAIAGDAGHIHSPAGGQGMNTGIGDAVNLAWKLADVLKGRAAPSLLDSYEPERITFARALVATTDRLFQAMVNRDFRGRIFRTVLVPSLAPKAFGFKAVRRAFFRGASQIRISYRGSPLSSGLAGNVQAGDRLPYVRDEAGDNFSPLASLAWQVHVYGDIDPALETFAATRGLALHVFPWQAAMEKAGLRMGAIYLVRPDGHVAFASPMQDIEALAIYITTKGLVFESAPTGAAVQGA